MINKVINNADRVRNFNSSVLEKVRIAKAESVNKKTIEILSNIQNMFQVEILRSEKFLLDIKPDIEDYLQTFSTEYDVLYEEMNDGVMLILRRMRNGYFILMTDKTGDTRLSKSFVNQIDAMSYFVKVYKEGK